MGYHLAQRGLSFQIADAGTEVGHVWRSRWDSLRLFTPAQYDNLPGLSPITGNSPELITEIPHL
jgi:putative flavoprotein involved in K+ transport